MSAIVTRPPAATQGPEEVLARAGSNFATGFLCLDAPRRDGMTAIYAFCRAADDAVDDAPDLATGRTHLQFWRDELAAASAGNAATPVGRAVQAAMQRFGLPAAPLDALLDGMAMDLEPAGIADEVELHRYCWRVASAVGLACLPVLGATEPAAERFADALGKALQLTNILRDLRADAEVGRVYAPRSWLAECAVEAEWLRGSAPDAVYAPNGPIARLAQRLALGAREQFALAHTALHELPRSSRRALVPARIMGAVYRELLRRLERRAGELRGPRTRVPKAKKLWLALQVFAGVRA